MLFGLLFGVVLSPNTHTKAGKNICIEEKVLIQLTFNSGLALSCFRLILPFLPTSLSDMSPRSNRKPALGQR